MISAPMEDTIAFMPGLAKPTPNMIRTKIEQKGTPDADDDALQYAVVGPPGLFRDIADDPCNHHGAEKCQKHRLTFPQQGAGRNPRAALKHIRVLSSLARLLQTRQCNRPGATGNMQTFGQYPPRLPAPVNQP